MMNAFGRSKSTSGNSAAGQDKQGRSERNRSADLSPKATAPDGADAGRPGAAVRGPGGGAAGHAGRLPGPNRDGPGALGPELLRGHASGPPAGALAGLPHAPELHPTRPGPAGQPTPVPGAGAGARLPPVR